MKKRNSLDDSGHMPLSASVSDTRSPTVWQALTLTINDGTARVKTQFGVLAVDRRNGKAVCEQKTQQQAGGGAQCRFCHVDIASGAVEVNGIEGNSREILAQMKTAPVARGSAPATEVLGGAARCNWQFCRPLSRSDPGGRCYIL